MIKTEKKTVKGCKIVYTSKYTKDFDILSSCNDSLEFVKQIPTNSVSLVVSSPPYNIGKSYEKKMDFEKYLEEQKKVLTECVRILKLNGSLCWEVGNFVDKSEIFPLDIFFYNIFKELGLKLRNRIVWRIGHGLQATKRFSGRYETILWFTKTDDYTFNLDDVRIPQKYPGKRAFKGPNKGKPTCNPLGKNPSDVWDMLIEDWKNEIWEIPNVKHNHIEKTEHPAQYPVELIERLVLALTNKKDIVFDPYVGVGSSILASIIHDRKAIGVDREQIYTDIAFSRIQDAINGELKRRPLGKALYKPKGTEKVATVPKEWTEKSL